MSAQKGLASIRPTSRLGGRSGFTLVELLVVISIIAILAVMGITVFSGVQKNARDAKRKGDIDAIAKALEVNKSTSYQSPQGAQFASGNAPYDPLQSGISDWNPKTCGTKTGTAGDYTSICWYCYNNPSKSPRNPLGPGVCQSVDGSVGDANWGSNITTWIICANLEGNNPNYYCKSNQQ